MSQPVLISGPHAHAGASTTRIMLTVAVALLPATGWGVWTFGWPALLLFLVTVLAALLSEAVALRLAGKPVMPNLTDGSALLTGWLLAMTLPPWAPWWIGVVGSAFGILVGKHIFGGLGQNLFNPAMLARVMLLVAFPVELTTWPAPLPLGSAHAPGLLEALSITFGGTPILDTVTGATPLGHVKTAFSHGLSQSLAGPFSVWSAALGDTRGSMGETSALLVLGGGLLLLWTRIITWQIPAAMLGTLALASGGFHLVSPERFADPAFQLLSGAALLGAFFIATDLVTSPSTPRGQLVLGAGCGALVFVIRTWGSFPEGVAFAVLMMNAATPLIDRYTRPRIYGRTRRGAPLPVRSRPKGKSGRRP